MSESIGRKVIVLLFVCSFLLPIVLASDDWPMFKHDPQHTGYTDCEMPDELELLWKYKTGGPVASSPAVVNGKVYFGSDDYHLYCLDIYGNLLWKYKTGSYVDSSPAVVNGKVYFGSNDGTIYCFGSKKAEPNYLPYISGALVLFILSVIILCKVKKKPEKPKEKPIEKKPEEKPLKPSEKQISPELQKLLNEREEWRKKLEDLKENKEDFIKRGVMTERIYKERYEEIMDKLVDIEDKIIQERMKRGKKK